MKRPVVLTLALAALAPIAPAQLTPDQRVDDFRNLASLFAYMYGPYEWKRDFLKYDAFELAPWLEKVRNVKDDLAYYDLAIQYVASLNDAHSYYLLPSTFGASLGFTVDIYDGKVLVDSIDRTRLPAETFKFEIGDELVSMDGKPVEELIKSFEKYSAAGNPLSTRRRAAALLVERWQQEMPYAPQVGDNAEVVIRRASGEQETYSVPWQKTGVPLSTLAPGRALRAQARRAAEGVEEGPAYLRPLRARQNFLLPRPPAVLGERQLKPVFNLPEGFVLRLGARSYDPYYSGSFEAGGLKIGYIRIPDFQRSRTTFEREITWFQENTDGLVIDVMRNPGGSGCTTEALLARLMPSPFRSLTQEQRVAWSMLLDVLTSLEEARQDGADATEIEALEALKKEYEFAYRENGGRTRPLGLCGLSPELNPATDPAGGPIAYTKPLMVLVDEMSASCGDIFPAVIQDNRRGLLFGMRTMGAGGAVASGIDTGVFSEASASVTISLISRKEPVATSDYPTAPYLENIGVRPDVVLDYMTRDNLVNNGKAFVEAFVTKMVEHIQASR